MAGIKHDDGKLPWDLLPFEAVQEVVAILQFGARKYNAHNWRKGMAYTRLIAAAFRHLTAWAMAPMLGQDGTDPETGRSHLAHAACCILFLLSFEVNKMTQWDDRFKPDASASTPSAPSANS